MNSKFIYVARRSLGNFDRSNRLEGEMNKSKTQLVNNQI